MNSTESNQGIISKDFKIQLGGVYDQYIFLKTALVNSDAKAAGSAVRENIKSPVSD